MKNLFSHEKNVVFLQTRFYFEERNLVFIEEALFLWNELRFKRSITFLWNKFSILATKLKLKELISIFKIKEGGIEKEFRFF
jgi:hypothetical protein